MGLTFKENCPDIRNSKVFKLIEEYLEYGCDVYINDPIADISQLDNEYNLALTAWQDMPTLDALVVSVAHKEYLNKPIHCLLEKLRGGGYLLI